MSAYRAMQVQKQHLLPSSIEDDLREGPDSRLGKTDGGGEFFRHPYSLATFDTIPIHPRQVHETTASHTPGPFPSSTFNNLNSDRLLVAPNNFASRLP